MTPVTRGPKSCGRFQYSLPPPLFGTTPPTLRLCGHTRVPKIVLAPPIRVHLHTCVRTITPAHTEDGRRSGHKDRGRRLFYCLRVPTLPDHVLFMFLGSRRTSKVLSLSVLHFPVRLFYAPMDFPRVQSSFSPEVRCRGRYTLGPTLPRGLHSYLIGLLPVISLPVYTDSRHPAHSPDIVTIGRDASLLYYRCPLRLISSGRDETGEKTFGF